MMRRAGAAAFLGLLGLVTVSGGVWGVLALAYAGPQDAALRYSLTLGFAVASAATVFALGSSRMRRPAVGAYLVLFAVLGAWWRDIEPSNDRNWQTDVAVLPYATIEGDSVRLHNIRNFDYRSEFDYSPAYYDKQLDLGRLEGVDLVAVYWMGPAIAHVFVSFHFAGGDHVAISIEARKETSEGYSTTRGFFRQYELHYVVADERDVIRLRTNYRHDPPEDVYVYRLKGTPEGTRSFFMEYMRKINSLKERPEFYNTLTTNCTTNIWLHSLINPGHLPFSWKILASGYVPRYLYEQGRLETGGLAFADLQRRAHINARAHAADAAADFSRRIRQPDGGALSPPTKGTPPPQPQS